MDDILASIRRILDEEGTRAAGPVPSDPPPAQAGDGVLELDRSMMLPDPDEAAPGPVPGPPPILAEPAPVPPLPRLAAAADPDAVSRPAPQPPPVIVPPVIVPMPVPAPLPAPLPTPVLVAPAAAAAAASSVGALMRTLASERSTATSRGGPTIEDLVREEMRPLLKEWLDTHLPPLVERLVRAEIERVVGRTG